MPARRYTLDEACNSLSADQLVYIYDGSYYRDGDDGYCNSTLEYRVQDHAAAGQFTFETAHKIGRRYDSKNTFLYEPVPNTIESTLNGIDLATAILSVPAGYDWLLRSHERGYFANVMTSDFEVSYNGSEERVVGRSFKAIADTPQAALAGAVNQAKRSIT